MALLAACGGDAPNVEAFAREADARCAVAEQQLEAVGWPADDELSLETAAPAIADTAEIHRDLVIDLRELAGDGPGLAVVEAGERVATTHERLHEAAARGDRAGFDAALTDLVTHDKAAAEASRRLGLRTCYDRPAS